MNIINEKYQDIVREAKDLFWRYGIKKVTVEEICAKAGVSRVTFYKYFDNKEKLALNIIKAIVEDGMKEYDKIMKSEVAYPVKVQKIIELKIRSSGELSSDLLKDLFGSDFPEIQEFYRRTTFNNLRIFENDIRDAQWNGDIRKDIKVEFIMFILNRMVEMARDENLNAIYSSVGDLLTELTRFFFYGVIKTDKDI